MSDDKDEALEMEAKSTTAPPPHPQGPALTLQPTLQCRPAQPIREEVGWDLQLRSAWKAQSREEPFPRNTCSAT